MFSYIFSKGVPVLTMFGTTLRQLSSFNTQVITIPKLCMYITLLNTTT